MGAACSYGKPMEEVNTSLISSFQSVLIWISLTDLQSTIQFDPGFTATLVLHPATYLNKVLVSSVQGEIQLWNIRTQWVQKITISKWLINGLILRTCIHKFSSSRLLTASSQTTSTAISALTQSPAIDVVGVGFVSGEISVYDIRADERLMRMFMDGGGIRALAFRSGKFFLLL